MAQVSALSLMLLPLMPLPAACGGERVPTDKEIGMAFAGTEWRIAEMHGLAVSSERDRCPPTLTFDKDGSFGGTGIVNDYASRYSVVDGLVHPRGIVQNLAAAVDEAVNRRERALFAVVSRPFALRPTARGADLVDAKGQNRLRLRRYRGDRCAQGQ